MDINLFLEAMTIGLGLIDKAVGDPLLKKIHSLEVSYEKYRAMPVPRDNAALDSIKSECLRVFSIYRATLQGQGVGSKP